MKKTVNYIPGFWPFWYSDQITVTDKAITSIKKNLAFFGLIPMGENERRMTLNSVSGVHTNRKYSIKHFIFAFIWLFISIPALGLTIPFLLRSASKAITSQLVIERSSGAFDVIDFPFFQAAKADEAANYIKEVLDQ